MLQILIFAGVLFKAALSHISGYGNLTAEYGGDANYRCAVTDPAGVLQVTWQRLLKDDSVETLATYSKRFGRQVNEPYQGKVVFTEASLSSSTITVKNVTWVDDSCYICSFNVYPDGSQRKQTCLTVQGISEVETTAYASIRVHDKEDVEVVFSCSATGRPAPTIQWDVSAVAFPSSRPQTTTATNSDLTFTSSRNISLKVPPDWNGYVDCLMNVGLMGERRERIPFHLDPGEKTKDKGRTFSTLHLALLICALLLGSCIVVAAGFATRKKRLKGNRTRDPNFYILTSTISQYRNSELS